MTDFIYPCGCSFDIFTHDDSGDFEFQVEDDGFAFEPCEQHKQILIRRQGYSWTEIGDWMRRQARS